MKYIENNSTNPYYNLALEEYILTNLKDDDYLLFWQNDNTIVVGKFQNTIEEIHVEECKKHNISVVRRNTGGGAVYHDLGNLNFSFITDWKQEEHSYHSFLQPVIDALKTLGIEAENSGRNDLVVGEYKISGNAQTIVNNRVLHHGTILINSNLSLLSKVLTPNKAKIESKALKSVKSRVANVCDIVEKNISVSDVILALQESLSKSASIEKVSLDKEAIIKIKDLEENKYRSHEWNYSLSPKFNYKKTHYFQKGLVSVELFVDKGIIQSCKIYGDFLAVCDISEVEVALKNVLYKEEDILKVLSSFDCGLYFGGIKHKEILSCLI